MSQLIAMNVVAAMTKEIPQMINGIVAYKRAAMEVQLEFERIQREFEIGVKKLKAEHEQALTKMHYRGKAYEQNQKELGQQISKLQEQRSKIFELAISNAAYFEMCMEFHRLMGQEINQLNELLQCSFDSFSRSLDECGQQGRVYDMEL